MRTLLDAIGGSAQAILAQGAGEGSEQVPPLFKVKAYLILILLMAILLGLFAFNRLMARWARRNSDAARKRREQSADGSGYDPDDDDWTRDRLVDDGFDD